MSRVFTQISENPDKFLKNFSSFLSSWPFSLRVEGSSSAPAFQARPFGHCMAWPVFIFSRKGVRSIGGEAIPFLRFSAAGPTFEDSSRNVCGETSTRGSRR